MAKTKKGATQPKVDRRRLAVLEKVLKETSSGALSDTTTAPFNPRQLLEAHTNVIELIDELRAIEKNIDYPRPKRTQSTWYSFFSWTQEYSKAVTIKQLDADEWALVSKKNFDKDSIVVKVPRSAILSTESISSDTELLEFASSDPIASSMPNVVLVLHLLNEFSKGRQSKWSPYLNILPSRILSVLNFTKQDLENLLYSSHLNDMLKMIRSIARQYSYFYERLQSTKLPLTKHFTYEYYAWGVSVICSRQNEIPPSPLYKEVIHVVHALIPILDMCNHSVNACQASYDEEKSLIFASECIKPGDEIFINYGYRSSGDFYIHNGFVPDEVRKDSLPLSMSLNINDPINDTKQKLLQVVKLLPYRRFKLFSNQDGVGRDPHLVMFLIIHLLSTDDLKPQHLPNEYLQFLCDLYEKVERNLNKIEDNEDDTAVRIANQIENYLSKRCAIAISLLDRMELPDVKDSQIANIRRLLSHERAIYSSYIMQH